MRFDFNMMEFIVRQSNILIICFIIFIFAFLGYSLWQSNSKPFSDFSKEQQEADMKMAEKYLHNAEPERSLPIIHQYKEAMEKATPEGLQWLNLFVRASTDLEDTDQLMMIYHFKPEIFKSHEPAALHLAAHFSKNENEEDYNHLRHLWMHHESNLPAWTLLDADMLLQKGEKEQAYTLLKNKKWSGKENEERLLRIALIKLQEDPSDALEILNAQAFNESKNPEMLLFRGKIFESQQKINLAEMDFKAAASKEPRNVYLQDQLAEFYRRQKNYPKAVAIWQKIQPLSPNDQMLVKNLFWGKVTLPSQDKKASQLTKDKTKSFSYYLAQLKPGQFWDVIAFEKLPQHLEYLKDNQASYWLRLLQALKINDDKEALTILNHNPFENSSWAPLLELTLKRILNYRQHNSLQVDGDTPQAEPLINLLSQPGNIATFYKEIDKLAQQEVNQGSSFTLSPDLQSLLCNPEVFSIALFSEGWTEAGLQLHQPSLLSSDFPDWVPVLYVNALRQNRGNLAALKFIEEQKPTSMMTLLSAEISIAEGKIALALPKLEALRSNPGDIGARAAWLLSLHHLQNKNYRSAGEIIESHPKLSQTLEGQEALGRIANLEGEPEVAAKIYQKIVNQSTEAKSFLARKAYQEKKWAEARELTEKLLNENPGNPQLQDHLKKIIAQEDSITQAK